MRVCMTFYRTLAIPLIGITLICGLQVLQAQTVYFILRVFWVKVFTSVIIGAYITIFRNEQFIFYNNLGYSRTDLLVRTFILDFTVWLIFMTVVAQFV